MIWVASSVALVLFSCWFPSSSLLTHHLPCGLVHVCMHTEKQCTCASLSLPTLNSRTAVQLKWSPVIIWVHCQHQTFILKLVSIRARYAQFLTTLSVVRAAIHFFCNPFLSFFLFLIQEYWLFLIHIKSFEIILVIFKCWLMQMAGQIHFRGQSI